MEMTKAAPAPASAPDREQWILDLLPVVCAIAFEIKNRLPNHVEVDDLISAGVCGLIDAAGKFEAGQRVKFATYARFRIRGAILDSLREFDWAPRDSRRVYKLVQGAIKQLYDELLRSPTEEEVAGKLRISLAKYRQMWRSLRACRAAFSLSDRTVQSSKIQCERQSWPDRECGTHELDESMAANIHRLPERYQHMIHLLYWDELTQREVAIRLGVVESRISQMHAWALEKLHAAFEERGIESSAAFQIAA
jgi:RNA polymerase sigma factor for flagellar operon FliA